MKNSEPSLHDRANEMRKQATPSEKRIWRRLRNRQLNGLKFRRQHVIAPYVVDFCCIEKRLIIEIDGDDHAGREEQDESRTLKLAEQGYRVIRFTNNQVKADIEAVLLEIIRACE